jgi:AcrR family transcriptional regulator
MAEVGQGGAPAQLRALRAQGRRTMRKLLNAGMRVFDERGYQAARVDDVVKAARTSHGTFYLYFANKEDLFRVLAEDCVAAMQELADDFGPVGPGPEGYQQLRTWLARFVGAYRRHGPVIRAWAEAQLDNRELARLGGASMNTLTSRIAAVVAERDGGVHADHAAVAVVAMVERLNYYLLSRRLDIDDDELLDTMTTVLHAGVFGGTRA